MVSKGAKEVVPISMIQGRKRNSINGELVIDPTDPSYREEVSPTTPADIYNHHNTVTVDPNQKQKDTINITDDPAATDNPSAWKERGSHTDCSSIKVINYSTILADIFFLIVEPILVIT